MASTFPPTAELPATTLLMTAGSGAPGRLTSLDIFRGLTIAGMILVNDPGTWAAIYWPLEHAEWNGWTPTDLIFPFFLFIVGVAMVFSYDARRMRGDSRATLMKHAIRRGLIIWATGFLLAAYPYFHLSTVRIPGVLTRIAWVYLCASPIYLFSGRRARIVLTAALLLGYWALMTFVPVPGFGAGNLTPDGALSAFIDRKLIYEHLWVKHRWDPEGFLSTLPAIATTLTGIFVGEWLRSAKSQKEKLVGLFTGGAAGLAAGELWGLWFPINKNLWTSSYVLFTSGFAMVLLGICYWLVEMKGRRKWGEPFVWLGSNAIVVFAAATFVAKCSVIFHLNAGGKYQTWHGWVYDGLFAPLAAPKNASLLFAICFVLVFWVMAWFLHRNKIFIKV